MIRWELLERDQPGPADIKQAIKKAKNLPDAGDKGHVQAMFAIYNKLMPPVPAGAWAKAKLKKVKLKKLQATNQQLNRDNLIWHLQHPGQSRFKGPHNTHPQVLKTNDGTRIIVDGHHRLSAMRMLGLKSEVVWQLNQEDL